MPARILPGFWIWFTIIPSHPILLLDVNPVLNS
jgi:hypothetical protein